ncbi:uncharacterized protein LOC132187516 [Corylus avellana]|uniref:uncharacterized protein LOC132187516 n=1 Tax=Corylus avellana TaxID=13451 RepID=UPI00286CD731|nr:uncharacterized protein LOC132187516 [Corylus avellana]
MRRHPPFSALSGRRSANVSSLWRRTVRFFTGFVEGFRSHFFKTRSTIFYQAFTITRLSTVASGIPPFKHRLPLFASITTRRSVVHTYRRMCPTRRSVCTTFCFPATAAAFRLDLDVEAFVTSLVLVPLSSSIPATDFDSAYSTLASFRWLMLFPSGGSNRFDLIWAPFASVTASCGSLRGPGHLFVPFLMLCNYFCTVIVCFRFVVGKPTPLLVLGLPILSSIRIRNGKDHPL